MKQNQTLYDVVVTLPGGYDSTCYFGLTLEEAGVIARISDTAMKVRSVYAYGSDPNKQYHYETDEIELPSSPVRRTSVTLLPAGTSIKIKLKSEVKPEKEEEEKT